MFPYLKSKKDFLKDCENVRYHVEGDGSDQNPFVFVRNNEGEDGYYSHTRGCEYLDKLCKGGCHYTRCPRIPDRGNYSECCLDCGCISNLAVYLTENVNRANWGETNQASIGSVSFSQIQAWCQSVGVFIHDVVKRIKNDNLVIGLEYYNENNINDNNFHCRADVMIAGYDNFGRKKMVIIELKQNDNNHFEEDDVTSALEQVVLYSNSFREMFEDFDSLELDVIPCVYFHNYTNGDSVSEMQNDTFICYGGTNGGSCLSGIETLSDYLDNILNGEMSQPDAKEIIKIIKQGIKVLSIDDMASIMYGKNLQNESVSFEDSKIYLRPDQKYVLSKLIEGLNDEQEAGEINVINGGTGSGKTLLVSLLIRYCIENEIKVALAYQGSAPINAIIGDGVQKLIKLELDELLDSLGRTRTLTRKFKIYADYLLKNLNTKFGGSIFDISENIKYTDEKSYYKINAELARSYKENPETYRNDLAEYQGIFYDMLPDTLVKWNEFFSVAYVDKTLGLLFDDSYVYIFDEFHRFKDEVIQEDEDGVNLLSDWIQNIIRYSQSSMFFVDELQSISEDDVGSSFVDRLCKGLILGDCRKNKYNLWSQFRCNNCEGYITWVEHFLQISTGVTSLKDLDYDVCIMDENYEGFRELIKDESVVFLSDNLPRADFKELFGSEKWFVFNSQNGFTTSRDENGLIRVGSPFQVQGVEYDKVFVVIDSRIDYIDGKISFTEEYNNSLWNKSLNRNIYSKAVNLLGVEADKWENLVERVYEQRMVENPDFSREEARCIVYQTLFNDYVDEQLALTKNRYRVLLTRGLKKCYIFAVNEKLRKYLKTYL